MKFKNIIKFVLPIAALFTSTAALAGDDPVNCRNATSYQPIYSGNATCTATYYGSGGFGTTTLSRYVFDTIINREFITGTVWGSDNRLYSASCWANVPFSHYDEVVTQVCDYTPKSSFILSSSGFGHVGISNRASDRDGNIVKTEWWVDGVYKGTTTPSISTSVPKTFSVRQKVTDNDGYTDQSTRSIFVQPRDFDDCGRKGRDQLCP